LHESLILKKEAKLISILRENAISFAWKLQSNNFLTVVYPEILFGGGFNNSVEDRENGDLGAVAP